MKFMDVIGNDEEIQELKRIIKTNGGHVPGFGFWDGETIDEYRIRLRKTAEKYRNTDEIGLLLQEFEPKDDV